VKHSYSTHRVFFAVPTLILLLPLLSGCAHSGSSPASGPAAPVLNTPPVSAPAPIVMTSYPAYRPLSAGPQTKAFALSSLTPGDNTTPLPNQNQPAQPGAASPIAQGQVSLDNYQFQIKPDGAGGSVLDGSASVHNHGPYDITDFQISLREAGRLYVLIPPGGNHQLRPAQGTVYVIHAAVPLTLDQLKTGKSFLLEAQLNGPPGLAMDEESGTTTLSTGR